MATEYIEKQAALDIVNGWRDQLIPTYGENDEYVKCLEMVAEYLGFLHAADVRSVKRGEWLKSPECPKEYDICSVCGLNDKHRSRGNAEHPALESIPPFCKWCGADMRPIPEMPKEGEK